MFPGVSFYDIIIAMHEIVSKYSIQYAVIIVKICSRNRENMQQICEKNLI